MVKEQNHTFKLMIPACGIETEQQYRTYRSPLAFKLMIPACGIETKAIAILSVIPGDFQINDSRLRD